MDFSFEKQLVLGLSEFNKNYKKKSKKEKITILGTENLRKRANEDKKPTKKRCTDINIQKILASFSMITLQQLNNLTSMKNRINSNL